MSMWKKTGDEETYTETPVMTSDTRVDSPSTSGRTSSRQAASIGPSIQIKGDISGNEDLVVHGKVEGTLSLPKNNVVVGSDGVVQANVNAMSISVEGSVVGDLTGSERIVITASGRVQGNIKAPRVVLEDGAKFKGSVDMEMGEGKSAGKAQVSTQSDKDTVAEVKRVGISTTS